MFYQNNRMLSHGTQTVAHVEHTHAITCPKKRVHLERADVVSWNAPRTHNHSLEALMRASAACCLWLDQAHAHAQTSVSEPQTHMPARGIHRA